MKKINISTPKYPNIFTLVDDKDFEYLNQWKWHKMSNGYSARAIQKDGKMKFILMHRFIMETKKKMEVDHINMDKLDNRRSNLRNVTSSQNKVLIPMLSTNTSGYRGVHWAEKLKKWIARISVNNKSIYLGCFKKVEDAVKAYNDSVLIHHKIERNS